MTCNRLSSGASIYSHFQSICYQITRQFISMFDSTYILLLYSYSQFCKLTNYIVQFNFSFFSGPFSFLNFTRNTFTIYLLIRCTIPGRRGKKAGSAGVVILVKTFGNDRWRARGNAYGQWEGIEIGIIVSDSYNKFNFCKFVTISYMSIPYFLHWTICLFFILDRSSLYVSSTFYYI